MGSTRRSAIRSVAGSERDPGRVRLDALKAALDDRGWAGLSTRPVQDGIQLKRWINQIRREHRRGRLPVWLRRDLEALPGWTFTPRKGDLQAVINSERHRRMLALLRGFLERHGWEGFHAELVYRRVRLGGWVQERRKQWKDGSIQPWLAAELEAVPGWSWAPFADRHRQHIEVLCEFVSKNGWSPFGAGGQQQVIHRGVNLSKSVFHLRRARRQGVLHKDLAKRLETIPGWSWDARRSSHQRYLDLLRALVDERPEAERELVVDEIVRLTLWVRNLGLRYRRGEAPDWLIAAAEALPGWSWT